MSNKRWIVIESGPPENGRLVDVSLTCIECGESFDVGIVGTALAQIGRGIVFESGKGWMPKTIRCPNCKSTITREENTK